MNKSSSRLSILYLFIVAVLFTGCSKASLDNEFKDAYIKGLCARWDIVENIDQNDTTINASDYKSYCSAELEYISTFKDKDFENPDLGKYVNQYIQSLEDGVKATEHFGNTEKFIVLWGDAQDNRYEAVIGIDNILHPVFSDEYDIDSYNGLISNGKVIIATRELMKTTKFEKISDDYGFKEYSTNIKNTTEENFDDFYFSINLIDSEGVIIDTEIASTKNWEAGSIHKFSFYTSEKFEKMEIVKCNYDF